MNHPNRPRIGVAEPRCPRCHIPLEQRTDDRVVERHQPGCPSLDGIRNRRDMDIEFLMTHPQAEMLLRPLTVDEHADLVELGAVPPATTAEARRWTVSVRMLIDGDVIHIGKVFRRDGRRFNVGVIESAPLAGAR